MTSDPDCHLIRGYGPAFVWWAYRKAWGGNPVPGRVICSLDLLSTEVFDLHTV